MGIGTDPDSRKVAIACSNPYIFVNGCRDGHCVEPEKNDKVGVRLVVDFIRICKDRLKTSPQFENFVFHHHWNETRVVWEIFAKGRRGDEAGHTVDRGTRYPRPETPV